MAAATPEHDMTEFNIYWSDLTPECQKDLYNFLNESNGNYDVIPIATLYRIDDLDNPNFMPLP